MRHEISRARAKCAARPGLPVCCWPAPPPNATSGHAQIGRARRPLARETTRGSLCGLGVRTHCARKDAARGARPDESTRAGRSMQESKEVSRGSARQRPRSARVARTWSWTGRAGSPGANETTGRAHADAPTRVQHGARRRPSWRRIGWREKTRRQRHSTRRGGSRCEAIRTSVQHGSSSAVAERPAKP